MRYKIHFQLIHELLNELLIIKSTRNIHGYKLNRYFGGSIPYESMVNFKLHLYSKFLEYTKAKLTNSYH